MLLAFNGTENSKKLNFLPSDRFIVGHDFLGHAQDKGQKIFFYNKNFIGIKRGRILRRFVKYKLTLVAKCT
jgi:hypothetical protein